MTEPLDEQRLAIAHRFHDRNNKFVEDMYTAALTGGNLALRTAVLINGGSVISLMSLLDKIAVDRRVYIANGILWFAAGVAFAGLGILLAYVTHYSAGTAAAAVSYRYDSKFISPLPEQSGWLRLNKIASRVAFGCCAISLILCFSVGVVEASFAIR